MHSWRVDSTGEHMHVVSCKKQNIQLSCKRAFLLIFLISSTLKALTAYPSLIFSDFRKKLFSWNQQLVHVIKNVRKTSRGFLSLEKYLLKLYVTYHSQNTDNVFSLSLSLHEYLLCLHICWLLKHKYQPSRSVVLGMWWLWCLF